MECRLIHGDCLEVLPSLESASVDAVIADPPYGTTACKWDSIIPLEPLWAELKRVVKPRGAVVMTASQPFTTTLISSNREWFRYCWTWDKKNSSGYLNAKLMPLCRHEDVAVFGRGRLTYNPQMRFGRYRVKGRGGAGKTSDCYGQHQRTQQSSAEYYPTSILEVSNAHRSEKVHPTQKPVALMEYLIRTYTNEGETILDFCFGSGTTAVACLNTGRRFVGVERDEEYFHTAEKRIAEARAAHPLFATHE